MRSHAWRSMILVALAIGAGSVLTGCSISQRVSRDMEQVIRKDGIDGLEARTLAQHQVLKRHQGKRFDAGRPEIQEDILTRSYPDHWFVSFPARSFTDHFWHYLVVVAKQDGKIVYCGAYRPLRIKDYDWVFGLQKHYP